MDDFDIWDVFIPKALIDTAKGADKVPNSTCINVQKLVVKKPWLKPQTHQRNSAYYFTKQTRKNSKITVNSLDILNKT